MIHYDETLGVYWPSEENKKDYAYAYGRISAIDVALKYVTGRSYALQAGGWIGMWGQRLAHEFEAVDVFEPVPYLFECARKNLEEHSHRVSVRNTALAAQPSTLKLMVETGGCTSAVPHDHPKAKSRQQGYTEVPAITIDSLNLTACDALFLDVERYELQVLEGAKETLWKFSPVLSLEVLKGEDRAVSEWALANGYRLRERCFNDWILTR